MDKIKPVHINKWLLPFSWIYRFIVFIRNKFFDWGIFKTYQFDIPIICIGNITVGGTGKTPHIEYLVDLLQQQYRVAVLSRGYKRKTKGFVLADDNSTSLDIGDEPLQIKLKFKNIIVAVDGNRVRGIKKLLDLEAPPQVILLDDAFQHRSVKPSYAIVLSDFNRPVYKDALLPAGRLREPMKYLRDANMLIVTKCPYDLQPIDYRIMSHDIKPMPYQRLFFTTFIYTEIKKVFDNDLSYPLDFLKDKNILLVTGIASPKMIMEKLANYTDKIETLTYPDHYNFRKKDIKKIFRKFNDISSDNKIILVTEKDATRLIFRKDINEEQKDYFYSLPIEVSFMDNKLKKEFDEKILKHVR